MVYLDRKMRSWRDEDNELVIEVLPKMRMACKLWLWSRSLALVTDVIA